MLSRRTTRALAIALVAALAGCGSDEPGNAATTPVKKPNRFDASRAMRLIELQVNYGQRPAGSPRLRKLAESLRKFLPRGTFEAIPNEPALRNIVGTMPGARPAIVLGAHYDTLVKPQGFVGANNGAAGSAIVIEVARALGKLKRPKGAPEIKFVLFDGEEPASGLPEEQADFYKTGLRGSRAYVDAHPGQTRAMVLLDYVANKGLRLPREASSDQALWARVRSAAQRVGYGHVFPDETGAGITDDHTPFLRAGVPAVDFIDWSYDGHSLNDGLDKLSRTSADAVGETVVELLRTLR